MKIEISFVMNEKGIIPSEFQPVMFETISSYTRDKVKFTWAWTIGDCFLEKKRGETFLGKQLGEKILFWPKREAINYFGKSLVP